MPNEISQIQRDKYCMFSFIVESKKVELLEAESSMVGIVDQRVQSYGYAGWTSSGDLMYNMATTVNDIVLYTWNLLREYI